METLSLHSDIKKNNPSLELYYSEQLTSRSCEYRKKLRTLVAERIKEPQSVEKIRNLDLLPQAENLNLSLSHCRQGSGFALINKESLLGFDMEENLRVTPKILNAIASKEEQQEALHKESLFTAKEALWKATHSFMKVADFKDLQIHSWRRLSSSWLAYKASYQNREIQGQGYSSLLGEKTISVFVVSSQEV